MKSKFRHLVPIVLAAICLALMGIATAQAQSPIHAEVDRTTLSTDETVVLTVSLSARSILSAPRLTMPPLPGFHIVGTSSSSQVSILNNSMSSQVVYVYRLQPYETGDLVIAPISMTMEGQTYSTEPITVHVTQGTGAPAPAPSSQQPARQPATVSTGFAGQDLFAEAEVDVPAPYVGQQMVYTFRFYQAVNLWGQPQYEGPTFTGFWSEQQSNQQEYQVQAAGRIYGVTEIQTILFPSVVGPVTIDPARLTIPGGFFRSGKTLQTKPVELNVQPLPANAPEGFGGAVGQFSLKASVDTTQGRVNEPLTWKVTLSGQGNLNAAPDPVWPEMPGWRDFESQATVNTEIRDGRSVGSRVYERLLVPSAAGEHTIPPLEYVYFDPAAGQYQTIRTEPVPVSIAPGDPGATLTQPVTSSHTTPAEKEAVEQLANDIRHLKPVPSRLSSDEPSVTGSTLYWVAWAFPLFAAAGYFVWQRRQRYWENNVGLAKSSQARRKARRALAQAQKQKQDEGQAAYSAAGQILTAYLSDKLNRPMAGLTHQASAEALFEKRVPSELVERVEVCLVTSELGRYAPGADNPDHAASLLKEVDSLIGALEKVL
jgi:hypothetical protein